MFNFLSKITFGLNFLGSIWVFGLALLICADITLRTLFNSPILGVPEIVQYSIAGIIYLQLGQATKNNKLIRSDAFISRSHVKFPNFTQYLLSCCDLFCAVIFGLLCYGMIPEIIDSIKMNFQIGNRLYFTLPDWPVKFTICLGAFMVCIHSSIQCVMHLGIAIGKLPIPSNPTDELDY
jgi:TRAP-type C4-dicarboxylate transport system permease small subunit